MHMEEREGRESSRQGRRGKELEFEGVGKRVEERKQNCTRGRKRECRGGNEGGSEREVV